MKANLLLPLLLLVFSCFVVEIDAVRARHLQSRRQQQEQAAEADTLLAQLEHWDRFLQGEDEMSLPIPPTESPVAPPTTPTVPGTCELVLNIECTLDNGDSCEDYTPSLEACSERPILIGMRYNGGGCSQSDNSQSGEVFSCEDFGDGPPTSRGTPSYIVVTDSLGLGNVYHEEWVDVGNFFNITVGQAEDEALVYVLMYSSQDQSDSNLLQFVQFDTSCSSPLELTDKFGAVEVTSWFNEDQGYVSAFTGVTIEVSIDIPGDDGGFLTLQTLVIDSNFAGVIDLSSLVAGQTIPTGEASISVPIPTNIDLTEPQTYSFSITLTGTTESGELCTGFIEQTYEFGPSDGE